MGDQIDLWKKGPSKDIVRLEWSTWITGTTLEWFDHIVRSGKYAQVGDNENGEKTYPTEAGALAAQQKAIAKKLAEGYVLQGPPAAPPQEPPSRPWTKKPARPAWAAKLNAELAKLRKRIVAAKLEHRAADIESLARPAIRLKLKTIKKASGVTSRFGGDPDVPASFRWPRGLAFVAQLRLDELAKFDLERKLPARGVLALFANLVPEEGYGEQAKVFHFPDVAKLERLAAPDHEWRPSKLAAATPSLVLTVPPPDSAAAETLELGRDERGRYHDGVWLASCVEGGSHQVLGWPDQMNQHAYTKGWELLAQINSDDRFGLELGDVEAIRFHIKTAKQASFASVRSAIGGE